VEFVTAEGEEIVALITVHAREIAEKYLADQRREEQQQREEEEKRQRAEHERMVRAQAIFHSRVMYRPSLTDCL
jgi:siroheme synthase (precorrin-2 oxidase/ferrochelatase)